MDFMSYLLANFSLLFYFAIFFFKLAKKAEDTSSAALFSQKANKISLIVIITTYLAAYIVLFSQKNTSIHDNDLMGQSILAVLFFYQFFWIIEYFCIMFGARFLHKILYKQKN